MRQVHSLPECFPPSPPVVPASSSKFLLESAPSAVDGVIQSEAGYSVVLKCQLINNSQAMLKWTLNGQPCQADDLLIIRRLAREHLGTYVCEAKNGMEQFISPPLTLKLLGESPAPIPVHSQLRDQLDRSFYLGAPSGILGGG